MRKKAGRPPVLDTFKKREILAILTVGCSRRIAAAYVGCDVTTIRNTALRDPEFAEKLGRVENQTELGCLRNIQNAAKKEQYWRAAAWILERRNPQDYALRHADAVTPEQLQSLLVAVAQIILGPVADPAARQHVIEQLDTLTTSLSQPPDPEASNAS